MSTAVAPPTAAPLRPIVNRERANDSSTNSYPVLAPMSSSTSTPSQSTNTTSAVSSADRGSGKTTSPVGKRSPNTSRSGGAVSKISVKKEPPTSPSLHSSSRHRPRKLDLSASTLSSHSTTSRGPLTSREGGLAAMHDVGLACLSPGFQTQDPAIREQLQRSISVRDQQRSIIESRLQKTAKGDGPDGVKPSESNLFGSLKASSTNKKRPPPGLSIVPPSASQFANERVIQSAPLNQTFTGRHHPHHITHHLISHPSDHMNSPSSTHIHHAPANQTNNRLPPIADVFGSDALVPRTQDRDHRDWDRDDRNIPRNNHSSSNHNTNNTNTNNNNNNNFYQSATTAPRPPLANPTNTNNSSNNNIPLPSPSLPINQNQNQNTSSTSSTFSSMQRPREYRSAEEAVHELAGGREDLLPRIIHYNGNSNLANANNNNTNSAQGPQHHHSPGANGNHQSQQQQSSLYPHHPHSAATPIAGSGIHVSQSSRRRSRNEYERDNGSPPLGAGPDMRFRHAPLPPVAASTASAGGSGSAAGNAAGGSPPGGYAAGGMGYGGGYGSFGARRDSPDTQRRKKDEFLGLCARAWDLFHS
ncbi:hypothetical protein ACO22_00791 [Paracoccidioides brasiliensis]|uniref:Uncharacterized protein n=1 Tax=Paracoccidioides brasiliensis TaxID=121759 RepID=A0A1D2JNG1_PARBR|nr:hypothetical protein ACO22_00791 [Paracoccidioides brasiliensis]ODH49980.1 hypothetical protein GX48_03926 [Paracoccidioides brasiliensis]